MLERPDHGVATGGAAERSVVMSLVAGKDHGKTPTWNVKKKRVSAYMMFSWAVREHMERTFGGAAAITGHFNEYASSEVCDASRESWA